MQAKGSELFFFFAKYAVKSFCEIEENHFKTLKCINRTTLAKKSQKKKSTVFITTYKNTTAKKEISGKCTLRTLLHFAIHSYF